MIDIGVLQILQRKSRKKTHTINKNLFYILEIRSCCCDTQISASAKQVFMVA